MCFFRKEQIDGDERDLVDRITLGDEVFQINYVENESDARDRFEQWLEEGLVRGLETWRSGL